jgi:hypothetical protein
MGDPALVAKYISSFGSSIAPVGLLPDKYKVATGLVLKSVSSEEAKLTAGIIASVGGLVVGLALSGLAFYNYWTTSSEVGKMKADIEALEPVRLEYQKYNDAIASVVQFDGLDLEQYTWNRELVAFLEELENNMPEELMLLSANFTADGVSLNIVVRQYEAAARTIVNFRRFRSIEVVEVNSVTRSVDEETSIPRVSFSLRATYAPMPPPVLRELEEALETLEGLLEGLSGNSGE